ncbi:MAG: hypothetical protein ACKVPJ_01825 [Chitinophagales bacterium]
MNTFPPQSKLWIYQSSRPFNENEIESLNNKLSVFSEEWSAHNQQLKAAGKVIEDRFILLMVDESRNNASGCSIDKSVQFLKNVEQDLNIDLFNRMLVSFKSNDAIETVEISNIRMLLEEGKITENTLFYNTLVQTKRELDERFLIQLNNSWLKQFV